LAWSFSLVEPVHRLLVVAEGGLDAGHVAEDAFLLGLLGGDVGLQPGDLLAGAVALPELVAGFLRLGAQLRVQVCDLLLRLPCSLRELGFLLAEEALVVLRLREGVRGPAQESGRENQVQNEEDPSDGTHVSPPDGVGVVRGDERGELRRRGPLRPVTARRVRQAARDSSGVSRKGVKKGDNGVLEPRGGALRPF
jgi:hypothetical protein